MKNDGKNGENRCRIKPRYSKVSKTLNGMGEMMKQSGGILANISRPQVASYSRQMPQGPHMNLLNIHELIDIYVTDKTSLK